MKLKITIDMSSAAFEPCNGEETGRILHRLAEVIEAGNTDLTPGATIPLIDINGNRVGEAKVTRS